MKKKFLFCYFIEFLIFFLCSVSISNASNNTYSNHSPVDELTLCVKPHLVKITSDDQEILLNRTEIECFRSIGNHKQDKNNCPSYFDSISCWPETRPGDYAYLPCPNYVNKFNKKHKAIKYCYFDNKTSKPAWSKSNYSLCLSYEPRDFCNSTSCGMENHMSYIVVMRVCGYITSMCSLVLSILILLRPKLRCPRNYVHINLFLAFAFRTIFVILSDSVTKASPYAQRSFFLTDSDYKIEKNLTLCRIIVGIFRYSGSIYHMAIFSEAIYLVLLLKFPYYNELRGSKFCILISWFLPIVWNVPWIFTKIFLDNYWCWQTESNYNLTLKIPHTLIYIVNICCAGYIIRILYSKMRSRTMSREKIMKYRRLAKSILIIIPIFGLHFVFFAWIPYLSLFNIEIGPCFEMSLVYIETFFNAFQGLVVSIVCCFIHKEVRVEFLLYVFNLLKKIKFLRSLSCLKEDNINKLRRSHRDSRGPSIIDNNSTPIRVQPNQPRHSLILAGIEEEENNPMLTPIASPKKTFQNRLSIDTTVSEGKKSLVRSPSIFSKSESSCCFCLFGDQKNDFFMDSGRKTKLRFSKSSLGSSSNQNKDKKIYNSVLILNNQEAIKEEHHAETHSNNNHTPKLVKLKPIIKNSTDKSLIQLDNNLNNSSIYSSSDLNLNLNNKTLSFSSDNEKNDSNDSSLITVDNSLLFNKRTNNDSLFNLSSNLNSKSENV